MHTRISHRRSGERLRVELDEIGWEPPGRPRRRFPMRLPVQTARVIDMSITGASVIAPVDPPLTVGQRVTIRFGLHSGIVEIRHIEQTSDRAMTRYGTQFVMLDKPLQDLVAASIAVHRPGTEETWRTEQRPRGLPAV